VRFDDGHLGNGEWKIENGELLFSFSILHSQLSIIRDGSGEDDFFESLFLYIIEFRVPPGTFFPCEAGEIVVVLFHFPLPPFDGGAGSLNNVDDFVIVVSLEDQLSPLKPSSGLG
jgi:hypothetical protein